MVRKISIEHPNPGEKPAALAKVQKGDILFIKENESKYVHLFLAYRVTAKYVVDDRGRKFRISDGRKLGSDATQATAKIFTYKQMKAFRKEAEICYVNSNHLAAIPWAPNF